VLNGGSIRLRGHPVAGFSPFNLVIAVQQGTVHTLWRDFANVGLNASDSPDAD
jgi:hypothetical protein